MQAELATQNRLLSFSEAIREALDQALERYPTAFLCGLGVPDPKGVFGTTKGLQDKYGAQRVFDTPTAENGMTGVAIGAALTGSRPIMVHQRLDFALLAVEQIANQAAKWHYMFGGQASVPLVIRLIVGRGWGQGAQHSQSLHSWFAHIPGLKVVAPANPYDAKGLLLASIADNNPVIFIEHRWLHGLVGPVPQEYYEVPLSQTRVVRSGRDLTLVGISQTTVDCIKVADFLKTQGLEVEVLDTRTLAPLDSAPIIASARKTGRVLIWDTSQKLYGASAEISAQVVEHCFGDLKAAPVRVGLPHSPSPTSPELSKHYYPKIEQVVAEICRLTGHELQQPYPASALPPDVPDSNFRGPF